MASTHRSLPFPVYALLYLLGMGGFFYTTYGFANEYASLRAYVPELVYSWEKHIPFLPWSIVPYWSLNLFYAASFFVCKDKTELHQLLRQLIFAQCIAIGCFLIYPLFFSWEKPESAGFSGALFLALAGFDQPYNQAPSLHIILLVILGRFYFTRLPTYARIIWLLWLFAIGLSVLTTYQHHFIDIPTGLFVGAFVLWAIPIGNENPIHSWSLSHHSTNRTLFWCYVLIAALMLFTSAFIGYLNSSGWFLAWVGCACLLVAFIYLGLDGSAFHKHVNGTMPFYSWVLFAPYFLGARVNIALWLCHSVKHHQITERVSIGSLIAATEFKNIVDLCAELPCPRAHHSDAQYTLIPILDLTSPSIEDLRSAANAISQQLSHSTQPVLVCCALGYGRSVAAVLTWLLTSGTCRHLNEAIALVKNAQPKMVISEHTQSLILKASK